MADSITTNKVGARGGPVLCPVCKCKVYYSEHEKCGTKFKQPWLRPIAEYKKRLHIGAGKMTIPVPKLREILTGKAAQ